MKKLLILFLFAGIAFSSTSCKKKECPKPEVRAVGTWKGSEININGNTDPTDPQNACYLSDEITMNKDGGGNWQYHYYDSNNTCQLIALTLDGWAENLNKNLLVVTFTYSGSQYAFNFTYQDKTHFKWDLGSGSYITFEKQN